MGIDGAALALAIVAMTASVARFLYIKWRLKLSPFSWQHVWLSLIFVILLFMFYNSTFVGDPILNIVIRSLATSVVFVITVYVTKISPEVNGIIDRIIKFKW